MSIRLRIAPVVFGLFWVLGADRFAMADDSRAARVQTLPKYQQECAACHVAYPPGMLPAVSWQRIMENLPRHFGTDASLDPQTVKELATWLETNAGSYKRSSIAPPEDRITRSSWFMRKHAEISADTWKRPAIKSASNCAACHTRANEGNFNERFVRIPR